MLSLIPANMCLKRFFSKYLYLPLWILCISSHFHIFGHANIVDAPGTRILNQRGVMPVKTMIFLDGTWLYHSLVLGRGADRHDPILKALGPNWRQTHRIAWEKLPNLIAQNVQKQLELQNSPRQLVDVIRTFAFSSLKESPKVIDTNHINRENMINDFFKANFHVQKFKYPVDDSHQEKCVDIALATEMLYMSTLPDALEVAILCSGDKDFIPALEKCRLLAKKVAICSMLNSCNKDLSRFDANIRDFEMIWIDDFIADLFVPKVKFSPEIDAKLLGIIQKEIAASSEQSPYSSRNLGKYLQGIELSPGKRALTIIKEIRGGLRSFLQNFPDTFRVTEIEDDSEYSFGVHLASNKPSPASTIQESPYSVQIPAIPLVSKPSPANAIQESPYSVQIPAIPLVSKPSPASTIQESPDSVQIPAIPPKIENCSISSEKPITVSSNFTISLSEWNNSSAFNLIREILSESPSMSLNVRELGRALQRVQIGSTGEDALKMIKKKHTLLQFISLHPKVFEQVGSDPRERTISLICNDHAAARMNAKMQIVSSMDPLDNEGLEKETEQESDSGDDNKDTSLETERQFMEITGKGKVTVDDLKSLLKKRGLQVTGKKTVLLERFLESENK